MMSNKGARAYQCQPFAWLRHQRSIGTRELKGIPLIEVRHIDTSIRRKVARTPLRPVSELVGIPHVEIGNIDRTIEIGVNNQVTSSASEHHGTGHLSPRIQVQDIHQSIADQVKVQRIASTGNRRQKGIDTSAAPTSARGWPRATVSAFASPAPWKPTSRPTPFTPRLGRDHSQRTFRPCGGLVYF